MSANWLVFVTVSGLGGVLSRAAGAILAVSFTTKFAFLSRIQIECDLLGSSKTYRHVFSDEGCEDMSFKASVRFTGDDGGALATAATQPRHAATGW